MTNPTPDDLISRLTGDDAEEAIPDALIHLIGELADVKDQLKAIDDDLGRMS